MPTTTTPHLDLAPATQTLAVVYLVVAVQRTLLVGSARLQEGSARTVPTTMPVVDSLEPQSQQRVVCSEGRTQPARALPVEASLEAAQLVTPLEDSVLAVPSAKRTTTLEVVCLVVAPTTMRRNQPSAPEQQTLRLASALQPTPASDSPTLEADFSDRATRQALRLLSVVPLRQRTRVVDCLVTQVAHLGRTTPLRQHQHLEDSSVAAAVLAKTTTKPSLQQVASLVEEPQLATPVEASLAVAPHNQLLRPEDFSVAPQRTTILEVDSLEVPSLPPQAAAFSAAATLPIQEVPREAVCLATLEANRTRRTLGQAFSAVRIISRSQAVCLVVPPRTTTLEAPSLGAWARTTSSRTTWAVRCSVLARTNRSRTSSRTATVCLVHQEALC